MSRGNKASKSKRGKNAPNAGAFGGQYSCSEKREMMKQREREREEARRREIKNAKRRAAYQAKKAAEEAAKEENAFWIEEKGEGGTSG